MSSCESEDSSVIEQVSNRFRHEDRSTPVVAPLFEPVQRPPTPSPNTRSSLADIDEALDRLVDNTLSFTRKVKKFLLNEFVEPRR